MATKYITDFSQLDLNEICTDVDYLQWRFEERLELMKGRVFKMVSAQYTSTALPNLVVNLQDVFKE